MDGGLFIPNYGDRMAGQVGASDVTGRWDRWSARKLAKWAMRTLFGNPWTNTRNRYLLETYGALCIALRTLSKASKYISAPSHVSTLILQTWSRRYCGLLYFVYWTL